MSSYHQVHLKENKKRTIVWNVITEYLANYIPVKASVLELGAGYCDWINNINASNKVALDIWDEMPKFAAPGIRTITADLSKGLKSYCDETYDVIVTSNLLEHFQPDVTSQIVSDVFVCLNPNGVFILIQPNFRYSYRNYFDDYTHRSVFTHISMQNLLRAQGFTIKDVQPRFMPYSLRESKFPILPVFIKMYLALPFRPFAGQMLIVANKPNHV